MRYILLFLIFASFSVSAQEQISIAPYKYVIVPMQFEFLSGKDSYRLNTQMRYLLKQDGLTVFFNEGEQLPEDLFEDRCLAMYTEVVKIKKAFLKTKLKIVFKDCKGNVVLESEEGVTKKKDYNSAYKEALKKAYETLDFSQITPFENPEKQISSASNEIIEVPQEKTTDITPDTVQKYSETKEKEDVMIEDNTSNVEVKPMDKTQNDKDERESKIYIAKKNDSGYELIDERNKTIMFLLKTATPDIFLVKDDNAMLIKRNEQWIYSKNENGTLTEKIMVISF